MSDTTDEITGRATVTVKFVADGVRDVVLDLSSTAAGQGMTVQSVDSLTFAHDGNRLRITLPTPQKAGQEFTFTVAYSGIPANGLLIEEIDLPIASWLNALGVARFTSHHAGTVKAFRCISVTERDWDDAWLSEGFVKSRAQVLVLEHNLPDTPIVHRNLADMKKVLSCARCSSRCPASSSTGSSRSG